MVTMRRTCAMHVKPVLWILSVLLGGMIWLAGVPLTLANGLTRESSGCEDDTWMATDTVGAPSARWLHTAVWTGSEMLVWGGSDRVGSYLNTGGRYDPATDTWAALSTEGAPSARAYHTAVWTGTEMIVWGGGYFSG